MQKILTIIAPMPNSWVYERDSPDEEYARANFGELLDQKNNWSYKDHIGNEYALKIEVLKQLNSYKPFSKVWTTNRLSALPFTFLKITSIVEYSRPSLEAYFSPLPDDIKISFIGFKQLFFDSHFESMYGWLFGILLAANIARPGSFYFDPCYLFLGNKFYKTEKGAVSSFGEARRFAVRTKWPPLTQLSLRKVHNWLNLIPGFVDRKTESRLGRALAALSYLIQEWNFNDNKLGLVWALMGLETLYVRGNSGLQAQLFDKSEVYLGDRLANKKVFTRMYDFRSRFIHGDIDFIYSNNDFDATKEHEKFSHETYEAEMAATAILLSTLQKMCTEDRYNLEFEYKKV